MENIFDMADLILPPKTELFRKEWVGIGRRSRPRFRFGPASLADLTYAATGETLKVWLHDLSEGGISFFLPSPLETGTELLLNLKSQSQKRRFLLTARVTHATRELDGTWRIGCAFAEEVRVEIIDELL
jgi:hypothetical protein